MERQAIKVSIVITNYNGLAFLRECVEAVTSMSCSSWYVELIVVDNASTDGSSAYVRREYPQVTLITLDDNYGFAKANNIGVQQARGEYVVFLNNDTLVTPGWLEEMVRVMKEDMNIGVAGSKLLLMDAPVKINSAGGTITLTGGGYDLGFMDVDDARYNISSSRGYVCGASMIVRREEFLGFGGFDEDYFMYFEDVDLCWRYWLYGKTVAYVPASVVYHKFGGTGGSLRHGSLRVFCGTRNSLLNMTKNYEVCTLLFAFPLTLLYHLVKIFYFVVSLQDEAARAMIKGYRSFFRLLPKTLAKRRAVQARRRIPDRTLFDRSLINSLSSTFREFFRLLRA